MLLINNWGETVGFSRNTISRMKKHFFEKNLLRNLTLPNLDKLGFEILSFYHLKFNSHNPPSKEYIKNLDTASTIFLASREFEIILISAYPGYQNYKEDKMHKIRFLKENDFISHDPLIRKYMFERMVIIKDFDFAPISKNILKI